MGIELKCPYCGSIYRIGQDTIIATMDEAIRGTSIHPSMVDPNRPDLITYIRSDPERTKILNQKALDIMKAIQASLKKGQSRSWYCHKCLNEKNPCPYPKL